MLFARIAKMPVGEGRDVCPLEMAAILQSKGQGQRTSWLDKESLNSMLILCGNCAKRNLQLACPSFQQ